MSGKRLLIADSECEAGDRFGQALGPDWTIIGVSNVPAALAEIERQSFDAIIIDTGLAGANEATVFDGIRALQPKAIRFVAAGDAQKQGATSLVAGGNQFLAKPYDWATLKFTIERFLAADHCIINGNMRELIGRIRSFPTIPSIYLEVVRLLNNPDATTEEVGAVVAKDMALTTHLLRMLNSALFGLPQTITDPAQAVGLLGFDTVKSLVISVKLRSQYDKVKPIYFSIDNVWRHSTNVARLAKELALVETNDAATASAAYTGGLLHDLGKIILAANFDDQYHGAHAIARKNQTPLCEVESDIFGADHGQLAAYLLGLWGMPGAVIEAAALHHRPSLSVDKSFTALTAIHVANVLEHEGDSESDGLPSAALDMAYLQDLDLARRLPDWRRALGCPASAHAESSAPPAKPSAGPKTFTPQQPSRPAFAPRDFQRFLLAGLGCAALLLLLCWVEIKRLEYVSKHVEAVPVRDALAAAPPVAPLPVSARTTASAPAAAARPDAVKGGLPVQDAAARPVVPVPTEDSVFQEIKLQGIMYSTAHPSAILNGKLVQVNQSVGGCLVSEITPTSVTVEYQNHHKTLLLR